MKTRSAIITILVFLSMLTVNVAFADVGVGISPSKIVLEVDGGKPYQLEVLVFNSGDDPLDINLGAEGEIASFTSIEPAGVVIEPEPKPHALPIKNGRTFAVTFTPPASGAETTYIGTISATGSPATGSQFGGSVGVATQVELIVRPSASLTGLVSATQVGIAGIIIGLIIVVLLIRKAGISLKVQKKQQV